MTRLIEDMVDKVGGIANFILCIVLALIIASAFMVLVASTFMLWCKVG